MWKIYGADCLKPFEANDVMVAGDSRRIQAKAAHRATPRRRPPDEYVRIGSFPVFLILLWLLGQFV
jgi:hypothetical protein